MCMVLNEHNAGTQISMNEGTVTVTRGLRRTRRGGVGMGVER